MTHISPLGSDSQNAFIPLFPSNLFFSPVFVFISHQQTSLRSELGSDLKSSFHIMLSVRRGRGSGDDEKRDRQADRRATARAENGAIAKGSFILTVFMAPVRASQKTEGGWTRPLTHRQPVLADRLHLI